MCGIAGELSFVGSPDPRSLRAMTNAIAHRGPDDEGFHCDGPVGIAMRRLSIIDLSYAGHQPVFTEDRALALVFNGEIYNYREIRPDLDARGYRFKGGSDTEVLLNAIHCWGLSAALERCIGMFAFALWDARDRTLSLVRDRLGVKPLYYQKSSQGLLFGSEIKALPAHPAFSRELQPKGIGQFFSFGYTLGETTVFKNTFKLPAGHFLRVSADGETHLERYWSLDNIERGSFTGSYEDAADRLTELCDSAFAYRLVSDVPVGVFLSGGIDSTFLAAFLKKRIGADLEHITLGFTDPVYDEAPKAAQVARDLGLRHTVRTIDANLAQGALSRFVEIWDEPFGDTSGIPTSMLCKIARESVKVALSADGGDELFCGYESYPSYAGRYARIARFPRPLRLAAATAMRAAPYRPVLSAWVGRSHLSRWNPQTTARYEKTIELMKIHQSSDLIRVMNEKGWPAHRLSDLLNFAPHDITAGTVFSRPPRATDRTTLIDYMMRTDLSAFLGEDILTKVDRASMSVSLECRDPLLDHRLAEFAFSLPMDYLYHRGVNKRLVKKIIDPWISPAVLSAPKRGFSIPLYDWLRGPWQPLVAEHLTADRIKRVGVLNPRVVSDEISSFYKYRGGRAEKIMLMLNFQMWAERWLS
jgi:asparagine synthase (glutamine-hydrolysing)